MYRQLIPKIAPLLDQKKPPIILLLGLRQTGKTTLAKTLLQNKRHQLFNFDLLSDQQEFISQNRHSLGVFAERYRDTILFIDEVQKQPESTAVIKHLYDHYGMSFVLTGSSELKLRSHIGDTLAGRVRRFSVFPLSITEIAVQRGDVKEGEDASYDIGRSHLERMLVYGSLPALEHLPFDQYAQHLTDFMDTLLSKDVLEISSVRRPTKLYALARYVALQIGQLVNVQELATLCELSRASVYDYIDILEQLGIIHRFLPMSTNERKAIGTKCKIYFTDLGIRNALIGNFEPFQNRLDAGQLLENAVVMGLKRQKEYAGAQYRLGFFRSKTGSERDIVLKEGSREYLYEVKKSERYAKKKGIVRYITARDAWEYLL
ncbi:MAG: ATP-binding protein [Patescibacteria group bacterium]